MATGLISTATQQVQLPSSLPTGVQTAGAPKVTSSVPPGAQTLGATPPTAQVDPKNNIGQTGPQSPPPSAPNATPHTVNTNETVAGQLNSLLNKDGLTMQSARNSALEQANQRGLLGSSIAVGAAQRAVIDAALPIAQQDATTHATAAQSAQEANQNYGLSGYNAQLNSNQARENFGYNSELAAQNARATSDLQTKLKQMDINLDTSKMSSQERQNFTSSISPIIQQVESEIATIQRTPDEQMDGPAKIKAINELNTQMKARLKTLGSIYGYELTWDTETLGDISSNTATSPTVAAPGTAGYVPPTTGRTVEH